MSSEAEKGDPPGKKAENGVHLRAQTSTCLKENWPTVLKIVELVLTIFCIGLVVDPLNYGRLSQNHMHHVAVIYTAFGGYTIINLVFIISRILGERPGWKTSVIFSLVAAVIYLAASAVIITDWTKYMYNHIFHPSKHYMDMFISSGVFSIFTAVIYVIDAIFTYREEP